jgi:hypothetical protein
MIKTFTGTKDASGKLVLDNQEDFKEHVKGLESSEIELACGTKEDSELMNQSVAILTDLEESINRILESVPKDVWTVLVMLGSEQFAMPMKDVLYIAGYSGKGIQEANLMFVLERISALRYTVFDGYLASVSIREELQDAFDVWTAQKYEIIEKELLESRAKLKGDGFITASNVVASNVEIKEKIRSRFSEEYLDYKKRIGGLKRAEEKLKNLHDILANRAMHIQSILKREAQIYR